MKKESTNWEKIEKEFNKEFPDARIVYPQDLNINLEILKGTENIEIPRLLSFFRQKFRQLTEESEPEEIKVLAFSGDKPSDYAVGQVEGFNSGIKEYKDKLLKGIK